MSKTFTVIKLPSVLKITGLTFEEIQNFQKTGQFPQSIRMPNDPDGIYFLHDKVIPEWVFWDRIYETMTNGAAV